MAQPKSTPRGLEQIQTQARQAGRVTRQDVYEALRSQQPASRAERQEKMSRFLDEVGVLNAEAKRKVLADLDSYPHDKR